MARIAFVLGEDFEDSEFRKPCDGLKAAGHTVEVLGARAGEVMKGRLGKEQVKVEAAASDRDPASYDALVIPGGYAKPGDLPAFTEAIKDAITDAIKGNRAGTAQPHAAR